MSKKVKHKVGERRVLVVEEVAFGWSNRHMGHEPFPFCGLPISNVDISPPPGGYQVWIQCEKDDKFSLGELFVAECLYVGELDYKYSIWKKDR